jgi:steroid 5-alpha reductase family enzyme
MDVLGTWAAALPGILALAVAAWLLATARRNVGLVDIFWSLFFVCAGVVYAHELTQPAFLLLGAWGLRLAAHLAWRNWNAEEDHRYRAIRRRNEPGFAWKSAYLVFGLQALLAWVISAPLAVLLPQALSPWSVPGVALGVFGMAFESVADWQLARFKADAMNASKVMQRGLWRYTRHPNYFGECCVWWGFWLAAAPVGGAWTVFAPLVMTWLLLRVSGVALLEKDIGERRPQYAEYVRRTNAFLPGPRHA